MWQYFDILCYAVAVLILLANALLYSKASFLQKISLVLYAISVIVMGVFITQLWISLERPPLRTLAETRISLLFWGRRSSCRQQIIARNWRSTMAPNC